MIGVAEHYQQGRRAGAHTVASRPELATTDVPFGNSRGPLQYASLGILYLQTFSIIWDYINYRLHQLGPLHFSVITSGGQPVASHNSGAWSLGTPYKRHCQTVLLYPAPIGYRTLSDDARLTSVCRVHRAYKSRTERSRKTKIGTEVAHVTRDTTFKVKRSTCKGRGHIVAASRTAC